MHFFDGASTTPISSAALVEYGKISLEYYANPSSVHPLGIKAKEHLENCRLKVSEILKTESSKIFFTGGATESNNIVILSLLNNPSPGEIIISAMEHSSVSETERILSLHGWKVIKINCPNGYLDSSSLIQNLSPKTRMVCCMKVNNVSGTVQDVGSLAGIVRNYEKQTKRHIHFHCDAVQALGKIGFLPETEGIDSASFSAHKFNGPRGVGILWNSNKALLPLSSGGGQESSLRGGTENLPAISAMICALNESVGKMEDQYKKILNLRKITEQKTINAGFKILSPHSDSEYSFSPYILLLSTNGIPSEVFLRVMADKGYCLSTASACNSTQKAKTERVLHAMGIKEQDRKCAIRISFSSINTEEETLSLCNALKEARIELQNGTIK